MWYAAGAPLGNTNLGIADGSHQSVLARQRAKGKIPDEASEEMLAIP